jgi:hypothetical protein
VLNAPFYLKRRGINMAQKNKPAYRNSRHYNRYDKWTLILNIIITLLIIRLLGVTSYWQIILYAVVISAVIRFLFEGLYVFFLKRKQDKTQ